MVEPSLLDTRLRHIQKQIHDTATTAGRSVSEINLLAISKGQSIESIQQAYHLGLKDFGENYWQEAAFKMEALHSLPLHWHFIGRLQRNKIKSIASHFDWVHSVCRDVEIAALAKFRPLSLPPLNICLEVNMEGTLGKNGVSESDLLDLANMVLRFPHLRLRGLMVILDPAIKDQASQCHVFEKTRALFIQLNQAGFPCDVLSMGMSGDFIPAIRSGSTWIRLGQALFGERNLSG